MTTTPPKDYRAEFKTMPERIVGEREERLALAKRALHYGQTFLDDVLRGILPHDLVLIGAPTGFGKTELALSIAMGSARRRVPVHYFALEAEPSELERRTTFAALARAAYAARHPRAHELNYTDWYLGNCEDIAAEFADDVAGFVRATYGTLHTFYRGEKFDAEDLARAILFIHRETSLVIVDHLHYVDNEERDEHRGLGDVMKVVRDVSLLIGKPIILVAHLRKRDPRAKQLVATVDDFHGSSNLTKIATQVIAIERAHDIEAPKWYLSPTYVSVLKNRRAGTPGFVGLCNFDVRTKSYEELYSLGRARGPKWEPVKAAELAPPWAKHHRAWDADEAEPERQSRIHLAHPDASHPADSKR